MANVTNALMSMMPSIPKSATPDFSAMISPMHANKIRGERLSVLEKTPTTTSPKVLHSS